MNEEPMIWTSKGNLPLALFSANVDPPTYQVQWEQTPSYVKCSEMYILDGEVVKQSAHVLALHPLGMGAESGRLGG
jgi:hypothetical protein